MWLLISIALLALTACSNVPGMVKELSKSGRSWCLSAIG